MSNSIDPDETALYEPSHLDLCCLLSLLLSPVAVKELRGLRMTRSNLVVLAFTVHVCPDELFSHAAVHLQFSVKLTIKEQHI